MRTLADKDKQEGKQKKIQPTFQKVHARTVTNNEGERITVRKVMRPGKTRKDKESGAWANRFVNQQARTQKQSGKK